VHSQRPNVPVPTAATSGEDLAAFRYGTTIGQERHFSRIWSSGAKATLRSYRAIIAYSSGSEINLGQIEVDRACAQDATLCNGVLEGTRRKSLTFQKEPQQSCRRNKRIKLILVRQRVVCVADRH